MGGPTTRSSDGAALFARFAFPPNSLGYCGPPDSEALLLAAGIDSSDRGTSGLDPSGQGAAVEDLRRLARRFEGAWPYLQLIAAASGIADPLDVAVVEAYWIGSPLLDNVPQAKLGELVSEAFRLQFAVGGHKRTAALEPGACPHHNFHVFSVYPWVGLLKGGRVTEPLRVLEQCRVRWGQVEDVAGDTVSASGEPLAWTGSLLQLGVPRAETVSWRRDGRSFIDALRPGQWVAMHWDWVCDVLTTEQVAALREQTTRQLAIANGPGSAGAGSTS
jgi:hypothetical protein